MYLKLAETAEQRSDKLRFIKLGWTILEAKANRSRVRGISC